MQPVSQFFQVLQIENNQLRARITELEVNNQTLFHFWQQAYQRAIPVQEKEQLLLAQLWNAIAAIKFQVEQGDRDQALTVLRSAQKVIETLQVVENDNRSNSSSNSMHG